MKIDRFCILGIPIDAVDMGMAITYIDWYISNDNPVGYILAINPEKVILLQSDAELKKFFEKATLLIPDGIGAVLSLKILHDIRIHRVPGIDLMLNICFLSCKTKCRIFLFGTKEEINREANDKLKEMYPGINIVGRRNGYVTDEQMPELIDEINRSEAQVLFIALGSPRQEKWIADNRNKLKTVKICMGVGGSFDAITGRVKRAPLVWQKLWLEWFYRLLNEPSRIQRDLRLVKFIYRVFKAKLQKKH